MLSECLGNVWMISKKAQILASINFLKTPIIQVPTVTFIYCATQQLTTIYFVWS